MALRNAVALWTETTTAPTGLRRRELIHDKQEPARSFFAFDPGHNKKKLESLKELRDSDLLTEQEYQSRRNKLLDDM